MVPDRSPGNGPKSGGPFGRAHISPVGLVNECCSLLFPDFREVREIMKLGVALLFFAALTQAKVTIEGKAEAPESKS